MAVVGNSAGAEPVLITEISRGSYRGPRPSCDYDWRQLRERNIFTVINLQSTKREIIEEYETAENSNITYFAFPCIPFLPPSIYIIRNILTLFGNACRAHLYIHCRAGVDRTGYVCAFIRVVRDGWSVESAIQEWKDLGLHRWFYWWIPIFKFQVKKYAYRL